MKWKPASLTAFHMVLPAEIAGRFMVPLHEAACACTRPGDHLHLVARIVPERGEISLATAANEAHGIRPDPSVDGCLAAARKGKSFEPFEVPSDVVCPEVDPPKKELGPPFFRAPRLAGCGGPRTSLIMYPLRVDRRAEDDRP
jgi:hypothetical protein